ncbi:MAG: cytochrome b/b6 domain-containing protein [Thermoprotei archaeon]
MKDERKVLRWDKIARTIHWLFIIGVTAGLISGLPVFDGKIFGILYNLIGGSSNRIILHYYITTITLSIAIPLVLYRLLCLTRQCDLLIKRGEDWLPCTADIKKSVLIFLGWFGVCKERPIIEYHHPLEKFAVIGLHIGLVLLGISGIPMAFFNVEQYKTLLLITHDIGFMLVTIIVIGHVMLALNPVNWETLKAMLTNGKVSITWAKEHHPGWKIDE